MTLKYLILMVLLITILSGCTSKFDINDPKCPEKEGADCQPIVDREDRIFCERDNRKWIEENCPNFSYVD